MITIGADRSRPDGEGRTAAHFARKVKNEAVAAWLEKGIDAAKHAGLQSAVQLVVDCG